LHTPPSILFRTCLLRPKALFASGLVLPPPRPFSSRSFDFEVSPSCPVHCSARGSLFTPLRSPSLGLYKALRDGRLARRTLFRLPAHFRYTFLGLAKVVAFTTESSLSLPLDAPFFRWTSYYRPPIPSAPFPVPRLPPPLGTSFCKRNMFLPTTLTPLVFPDCPLSFLPSWHDLDRFALSRRLLFSPFSRT